MKPTLLLQKALLSPRLQPWDQTQGRTRALAPEVNALHPLARYRTLAILCISFILGLCSSAGQSNAASPMTVPPDSPEMKSIFLADQFDRGNDPYAKPGDPQPKGLSGEVIRQHDDERDARVKQMLDAGLIRTATDYFRAALIYQHSGTPEGTLLAHILASVAAAKGYPGALWLQAATLDRYLLQIGRKQVFGTQFKPLPRADETKPYQYAEDEIDSQLLSNSVRADFCVVPLEEQQKGLPGPPIGTSLTPCPAQAAIKIRATVSPNAPPTQKQQTP